MRRIILLWMCLLTLTQMPVAAQDETREADGQSSRPHISADGTLVIFASQAENLPSPTQYRVGEFLLYDHNTASLSEIIIPESTARFPGEMSLNQPTPDIRLIPFLSWSEVGDLGGGLYLLDRQRNRVEALNVTPDGRPGDGSYPYELLNAAIHISDNGRWVLFLSTATNLIPDDANGDSPDFFLLDRETGTLERILTSGPPGEWLVEGDISGDGRTIVFSTRSDAYAEQDSNGERDVYLYDVETGAVTLVSHTLNGRSGNGSSATPQINVDGRFVLFRSGASDLVPEDTNESEDVFLYDQTTDNIERVSVGVGGVELDNYSYPGDMTPDGRYVIFSSAASNAFPDASVDTGRNLYRLDRATGDLLLISRAVNGGFSQGWSYSPSVSDDGCLIAFSADASDLVPDDTNGVRDVFLFDCATDTITRISVPNSS